MRLQKLTLKNFKGIKDFTLDAQGGDIDIYGDNATGKTTLFDAFLWLMFGKDSEGKADFAIKTLDKNNSAISGLDHEVEGVFEIDGKVVTLRKVYAEKWTKKRGSPKAEFTGHTTDHFLDGVPVQKKEYDAYISEIVGEDVFKLLTNPMYFNEQLHWQERRETLLEVCGDISDADVIASDKALAGLPDILDGRKLDDHRKVIAARCTEINKELNKIPVRIDEVEKGLPDVTRLTLEGVETALKKLKDEEGAKMDELYALEFGGQIAKKRKQLMEIETQIIQFKNEFNSKNNEQIKEKGRLLNSVMLEISDMERKGLHLRNALLTNEQDIQSVERSIKQLRIEWHEADKQEFTFAQDDTCPTCGQALPEEQLEEARDKALKDFNRQKSVQLATITRSGKELQKSIDGYTAENTEIEKELESLNKEVETKTEESERLQADIDALQDSADDIETHPEYKRLQTEANSIRQAVDALKIDAQAAIEKGEQELKGIQHHIMLVSNDRLSLQRREMGQERIKELKAEEKDLAAEYERLEGELYLTEEFVRIKVSMLEEKINSKFKLARFKLFNVLVNGAVDPCCETLYGGVPYGAGLNNGARINVGLDIINTLSEHYNFSAPIFVDNAEAVTELINTRGQMIRLIVSEPDKKLRVEHLIVF